MRVGRIVDRRVSVSGIPDIWPLEYGLLLPTSGGNNGAHVLPEVSRFVEHELLRDDTM